MSKHKNVIKIKIETFVFDIFFNKFKNVQMSNWPNSCSIENFGFTAEKIFNKSMGKLLNILNFYRQLRKNSKSIFLENLAYNNDEDNNTTG